MDEKNASLTKKIFETRVIDKDRLYCQICFVSCLKNIRDEVNWKKLPIQQASSSTQKNGNALTIYTTKYLVLQIEITLIRPLTLQIRMYYLLRIDTLNFSLSSNFSTSLFFKSILRNVDLVSPSSLISSKNDVVGLRYRFHVFEQCEIELNEIVHVLDPFFYPKLVWWTYFII